MSLTLVDTAGLRDSHDVVEQEGIRRARKELSQADVAILVTDSEHVEVDRVLLDDCAGGATRVIVHNKIDLRGEPARRETGTGTEVHIWLSAQNGAGLSDLRTELARLAGRGE